MNKGERTRQQVLEQAASLFNQRGYEATSISDVMAATGLQKGGVYRHFESKQALSLAAFEFAIDLMRQRFADALSRTNGPKEWLETLVAVYERIPVDPPVPGGCPILNAAVEADDTNPDLQKSAQRIMDELQRAIKRTVRDGQRAGCIKDAVSPEAVASVLMCTLEGAVMMSKLYGSQAPMRHAARHLQTYIKSLLS